eukprot:316372_1
MALISSGIILLLLLYILIRLFITYKRWKLSPNNKTTVAFLHPYCAGGGGGERVLWDAIVYMIEQKNRLKFKEIIIYCANLKETQTLSKVLKKVKSRFDIQISIENEKYLKLIPLKSYWIIDPKYHPYATLLFQSLSAIILAFEGLFKYPAHIFIDTTGYGFTYPIAWIIFGCTVISYTHYPTISNDMLQRVADGKIRYNNNANFANNKYKKQLKLYYYKLFAFLYGLCGYFANIIMVNSTWTYNHINSIFYRSNKSILKCVYPPCGNSQYLKQFTFKNRKKIILSVGQFRPEKNHMLQIEAFYKFREKCKPKYNDVKLIMVGGVRDIFDKKRVTKLRVKIGKYNLRDCVIIKQDLEWKKLLKLFSESFIGLHTMEDEHFGICLSEYMIAGLVTIGHCSGGPLSDIVSNIKNKYDVKERMLESDRGFLCTTVEQYAMCFEKVFDGYDNGNGWLKLREIAREYCVDKFSCSQFQREFVKLIEPAFH